MRLLLILSILVMPVPGYAQVASSHSPSTLTPPTGMGRWDGYRTRQEQMRRQDDLREPHRGQQIDPQHRETDFAECVLRLMPQQTHDAVIDTANNREFNRRYGDPMRDACGRREPSALAVYHAYPVRAALAAELIRSRFAVDGPSDLSAVPPLWHRPETIRDSSGPHREQRTLAVRFEESNRFLSVYGECIARAAPEKVRMFLLTERGSPAEGDVLGALQPELAACLNVGATMRLDTRLVRQSLSYNYYRLAVAATAQRTGDAN